MTTILKFCPDCRKYVPDFGSVRCADCSNKYKWNPTFEKRVGDHYTRHPKKMYIDNDGNCVGLVEDMILHTSPSRSRILYRRIKKDAELKKTIDIKEHLSNNKKEGVCSILTAHHDKLSDDNEHLQTDFILNLIQKHKRHSLDNRSSMSDFVK